MKEHDFCKLWEYDIMFTIEHEFDCTVVTLMDEGEGFLQEDVVINGFEECITIQQFDPKTNGMQTVTMSITQMKDLAAAISLPEGIYSRTDRQD